MRTFETVTLLGFPFVKATLKEMADQLEDHVNQEEKAFVVTANPEIAYQADQQEEWGNLLRQKASYITADGIGVVKAARWAGKPLPERVAGFDLFMLLLQSANDHGKSIYLTGAKEDVLERAVRVIRETFPNLTVAGYHHGYFDIEDQTVADDIVHKQPDYLFVALGFPKQEQFIASLYDRLEKGVCMGIGGSFDVIAGEVNRAPAIWQKLNVEWLYRILKQPSRLKRSLSLPAFVFEVLKRDRKRS